MSEGRERKQPTIFPALLTSQREKAPSPSPPRLTYPSTQFPLQPSFPLPASCSLPINWLLALPADLRLTLFDPVYRKPLGHWYMLGLNRSTTRNRFFRFAAFGFTMWSDSLQYVPLYFISWEVEAMALLKQGVLGHPRQHSGYEFGKEKKKNDKVHSTPTVWSQDNEKKISQGWWVKVFALQAWRPDIDPWDPWKDGRREPTP